MDELIGDFDEHKMEDEEWHMDEVTLTCDARADRREFPAGDPLPDLDELRNQYVFIHRS